MRARRDIAVADGGMSFKHGRGHPGLVLSALREGWLAASGG
jgi:hypothetical protein